MGIKAVYRKGVLKPMKKLELEEGEEVEVLVKRNILDEIDRLTHPSSEEVINESIEITETGEDFE
jgi:predicted DNA-binding antitoxin AbrB/MazE fold protein